MLIKISTLWWIWRWGKNRTSKKWTYREVVLSVQSQTDMASQALPVPEEGLPDGWSMEQWQHYGHQYAEMGQTDEGQYEM